jgi:hypothetical protein
VFVTCLFLSHEMALREVRMYAWCAPVVKDPEGSTVKILKREFGGGVLVRTGLLMSVGYTNQMKSLATRGEIGCRVVSF